MKILHIVESLNRGAVENWLVRMFTHANARGEGPDWTFYCTLKEEGAIEPKATSLGARIIHSSTPLNQKRAFAEALRAELKRGRYDALHCHHDLMSGFYLGAAAGLPIRRRIVHIHNADEGVPTPIRWKQRLFRPTLRRICFKSADRIVGISNHTLDTFLAGRRRRPGRDLVHYYGVDPSPFLGDAPDRVAFRRALRLKDDTVILLFGGRIVPEKNPVFTVDVLASLRRTEPRAVAVFAGSGSEEDSVMARANELGVKDHVQILGWRNDLAHIMRACDWFILPRPEHPMEGFGLAVIEAQLAGLRLLVSRGVPDDPFLPSACFRRLSLSEPAERWADAALELLRGEAPCPKRAVQNLAASSMDMDRALTCLKGLYA